MTVSNGNFIDEEGNVVNIVQLLRNGEATPIVGDDGHYMRAHSGWYTDENGVPVNLITLLGSGVSGKVTGISLNGGAVVEPDENGVLRITIQTDEAVSNWLDDHPEATTTVQDGSITVAKLHDSLKAFVTPEMFGAVGDGVTDDTNALNNMFLSGQKVFLLTGTYKATNLFMESLENVTVIGGKLYSDSFVNQSFLLRIRNCKNITFTGLSLESVNDKDTFVIPGFSKRADSKSSNVIGISLEKCQNIVFNDLYEKNLLIGVWLYKNPSDEYDSLGNSNIRFNNIKLIGIHEGIHSNESNGVYIDGMEFDSTGIICGLGYHGFYFERNSNYLYIKNLSANVSNTAHPFFDFADYHTFDDMFNLAVDIVDSNVYAPVIFQFRSRNKYLRVFNSIFKLKPWLNSNNVIENAMRHIDVVDTTENDGKYPYIEFNDCFLISDSEITIGYLTRSTSYAKYCFNNCDINFRINTANVNAVFKNCNITDILVYIFSDTVGNVELYNCYWDLSSFSQSYALACRTINFAVKVYDCVINIGNKIFINNGDAASKMNFYNTIFSSPATLAAFQNDSGTGVVAINCYWNNVLLNDEVTLTNSQITELQGLVQ
jgi:hypothetical protein